MITKASQILLELKKVQKICQEVPFKGNDARGDFFKLVHDVFDNFYKGHIALEIAVFIHERKVYFSPEIDFYKENQNRFVEIIKHPILIRSYLGDLNRRVIIDIWSAFEVSLTSIVETVFGREEQDELLEKDYYEIIEILKEYNIDEKHRSKLNKKLTKKHLSHVSINQKYNKLFKKIKSSYERNIEEDKRFLDFWSKLRNTMHSNFIYTGNSYEYEFSGIHFIFEDRKTVKHTSFDETPDFIINMISEIILIFSELINQLGQFDYIPYLDTEAENYEL